MNMEEQIPFFFIEESYIKRTLYSVLYLRWRMCCMSFVLRIVNETRTQAICHACLKNTYFKYKPQYRN